MSEAENNAGPWPVVWVEGGFAELKARGDWPPAPGTAYAEPRLLDPTNPLSADLRHRPVGRLPIVVWMPGGGTWVPDCAASNDPPGTGAGWTMLPDAPRAGESMQDWLSRASATPSINALKSYHGHLVAGMLTPCVDGHRYELGGRRLAGWTARQAALSAHHEACEPCRRAERCAEGKRIAGIT